MSSDSTDCFRAVENLFGARVDGPNFSREGHVAALLPNGLALVAGGEEVVYPEPEPQWGAFVPYHLRRIRGMPSAWRRFVSPKGIRDIVFRIFPGCFLSSLSAI